MQALLGEFGEALRDQLRDLVRSIKAPLESSKDTVRAGATDVAKDACAPPKPFLSRRLASVVFLRLHISIFPSPRHRTNLRRRPHRWRSQCHD